jgi:hypothetical protein
LHPETGKRLKFLTNNFALPPLDIAEIYKKRWAVGVSSQGHMNQPVQVRPRLTDSCFVAWEASWSESETMKPCDNMLRKEYAQLTRLQRVVNADIASLHANPEAETVDNRFGRSGAVILRCKRGRLKYKSNSAISAA